EAAATRRASARQQRAQPRALRAACGARRARGSAGLVRRARTSAGSARGRRRGRGRRARVADRAAEDRRLPGRGDEGRRRAARRRLVALPGARPDARSDLPLRRCVLPRREVLEEPAARPRWRMKAVVEVLVEQVDPPLADDEIDALERQVTQHGILAPLVVWQGVLVDGHNRFRLARRHRLRFDVREVLLLDRASVVAWICDQALARRSLTPLAAAYLRGKRYETAKRDSASTRFEPDARRGQSDHAAGFTRTDERLSKEIGVGARTIRRDAEFARDLDLLVVRMGVELRNEILGRKLQMTRRDVHLVVERALVDVGEVRRFADDARLKRRRAPRAVTGEE